MTDWKTFFKNLGIKVGIEVAKVATKTTYEELEKAIFDDEAEEADDEEEEVDDDTVIDLHEVK